jgi:hypothetical protein
VPELRTQNTDFSFIVRHDKLFRKYLHQLSRWTWIKVLRYRFVPWKLTSNDNFPQKKCLKSKRILLFLMRYMYIVVLESVHLTLTNSYTDTLDLNIIDLLSSDSWAEIVNAIIVVSDTRVITQKSKILSSKHQIDNWIVNIPRCVYMAVIIIKLKCDTVVPFNERRYIGP